MPRTARSSPGGLIYHVFNRAVARLKLFQKVTDYETFDQVLEQAVKEHPIKLLGYCVMPNHWHMVLWPKKDDDLSNFLRWMTHTHTMRWHAFYHSAGTGHLYQGRFKSFPIQADDHLWMVLRYVEGNPLRAKLVKRAEDWRWSSLWRRRHGDEEARSILTEWPLPEPTGWLRQVNKVQTPAELEALHVSLMRGRPYGTELWTLRTVKKLALESTIRPRGRPRKTPLE
jgi:putative transposase